MNIQTLIGLTGISLLLAASVLRVLLFFKITKQAAVLIALIVFSLSYISISGDSINFYLRGIVNDLSISSCILLGYYFISSGTTASVNKNNTLPAFYLTALIGLFFYPAALGLGEFDPYSWGYINKAHNHYSTLIFIVCLAGLMYFSFLKQYNLLLFCLVLSTLTYQFGILESQNLWDYLLDPLIFIYALFTIIDRLNKKINPFRSNLRL
ncbi:MAG: hypothetical protein KZQ70_12565 [gamma proteobacterium symbiont of Lucinoma myriamae]|nr:hypothetical protein [gamma proteobacterium symbiont of Lucinoma myriamae]